MVVATICALVAALTTSTVAPRIGRACRALKFRPRHPGLGGGNSKRANPDSVTFAGGVELHDFYVPSGGDEPDPAINDKFAHKLQFLDEMAAWWREQSKPRAKRILVGDLNIAPLETDVWSHKQLLDVVSHTPVEVDRLGQVQASHDWVDAVRHFVPDTEKLYSWWSYRARDWRASNRGRRLDHVWVTPPLAKNLKAASVFADARDWPKASDHAPVVVDIDI